MQINESGLIKRKSKMRQIAKKWRFLREGCEGMRKDGIEKRENAVICIAPRPLAKFLFKSPVQWLGG